MGHIELAAPVSPYLVFQGNSEPDGTDPGSVPRVLEKVLYFASYIVLDKGDTNLEYKAGSFRERIPGCKRNLGQPFRVGMGAESIKELLQAIDLETEAADLKNELGGCKRTEACENHQASGSCRSVP